MPTTEILAEANEYFTLYSDRGLEGEALVEALREEVEQARTWGRPELAAALEEMVPDEEGAAVTRRLTTSRGDVVETNLTDEEAIEILGRMRWSEFATSLYVQFNAPRSRRKNQPGASDRLSPRQWPWVHKLANEQLEREAQREAEKAAGPVVFTHLTELFQHALDSGHKTPRITLDMDEGRVRLGVAGSNSRTPGAIHVTDGGPFGSNTYYGRIATDGTFKGRNAPDWVLEVLRQLDGETLEFVVQYGQRTGNCCFCARELTTTESVTAGYGPVCAGRYGLPWG